MGMDVEAMAKAYRRRANAREVEREERYRRLREEAARMATALRDRFGEGVRVHLFGSLVDLDRFRGDSDVDLCVEGLSPDQYWEAWTVVDSMRGKTNVDLVRMETAAPELRQAVKAEGEVIP